ncbi:transglycosylase SLT domain-containing protein [Psychromonas sp. KJ10-10]|uniref:transglycosylase SLT domain-containing protein n=1 Tax=Psychromonas sp. KJ10-10 TaxID=3391823 RepID=UPI0039B6B668
MVRFLLIITSLVFSTISLALSLKQQREVFSEAKSLQQQQRWAEASDKLATIPNYPLTYLLKYQQLKADFKQQDVAEIQQFVEQNNQYNITNQLQREFLYFLAKHKYWSEFLTFFPSLPRSNALKCYSFQAKMAKGQEDDIWPDVKNTWLSGYSQSNACDSVFKHYLEQDLISQNLIWDRFELAFNKNQYGLMRYLIKLLKGEKKQLASNLYALNNNIKTLAKSDLFTSRDNAHYPLLNTFLKRLARADIAQALETYYAYETKIPFSFADEISLKKYFAFRILINDRQELFPWLDKNLASLGDTGLIEQRIRYAIKYNNWPDIEYWISVLPEDVAKVSEGKAWVYWQARILENKKQFEEANKLYRSIADERKYYGFLVAQKLGLSYQLNAKIVEPKVTSLRNMQARLDHIEELNFHQYVDLVKREWESLLKGRDEETQRQLGLYAFDKGWAHLSVLASIRSKSWDAINIRFPEVKPELFLKNTQKYQVPSSYIYAITRQESAFDQFANSPVGARGYMQLMPATAKETAHKIGLKSYKKQDQLTEGEINVQLGTAYFDSLLKRYNGNRILATARYNAGPHRVDRWKQNAKGRDDKALGMDSWVETIPYKETRQYVKNVLAYNVIYQHILKEPMRFLNDKELGAYY